MTRLGRRTFLKTSAAAVGTLAIASSSRAAPGDRIRVAVMGVRGRGMAHVNDFLRMKDVEVAAVCDVDMNATAAAVKAVDAVYGKKPPVVQDIRRILEDKSIDAISIATCNHWHTLGALWAVQAGKDVYVEKPASHNVWEGRKLVEAARKYNRIVQHGTQSRSSGDIRGAVEFMRAGKLGKVETAVALCYKPRGSIGKLEAPAAPPSSVDYDLWLGPAPKRTDVPRRSFHYDWHWQWDYGNGDIGNQGVHQMDIALWGLGKTELPKFATSVGGRFGYVDDGQTPNTQLSVLDYGDSKIIFEVRGLKTEGLHGVSIGNIFYGTEGMIVIGGRPGVQILMGKDKQPVKVESVRGGPGGGHFGNFIAAVKSRKVEDLNADILWGHLSSGLCHMANVSYRLAKEVAYTPKTEIFSDCCDAEACKMLAVMTEHLGRNNVKLDALTYRVGKTVGIDPKTEKAGDAEVNKLFTREYRTPFVVPENV
jgi:predicted dehydrogenase